MKATLSAILLILGCISSSAQKNTPQTVDSLKNELLKTSDIHKRDTILNTLIFSSISLHPQELRPFVYELAKIALNPVIVPKEKLRCYQNIGNFYNKQSNNDSAAYYYKLGLRVGEENGLYDSPSYLSLKYNMGLVSQEQGNFQEAFRLYQEVLEAREKLGLKKDVAKTYQTIGTLYQITGENDLAIANFYKALKTLEELGDKKLLAMTYHNLATSLLEFGDTIVGKEHLKNSLEISKEIGSLMGQVVNYDALATLEKDPQTAIELHLKTMELRQSLGDPKGIAKNLVEIGRRYSMLGQWEQAEEYLQQAITSLEKLDMPTLLADALRVYGISEFKRGDYQTSIKNLQTALALSQQTGFRDMVMKVHISLSDSYAADGNYLQAFQHLTAGEIMEDSIFNEQKNKTIAEMKTKFETEQKEREITLLEKDKVVKEAEIERRKAQVAIVSLVALLLLGIGGTFYFSNRYRQKLKLEQMRTRIASDLHDEVGSSLSHLNLLIGSFDMENAPERTTSAAEKAKDVMARTASNIRDVVWAIDARRDKASDLLDRMEDFAYDLFSQKGVQYQFFAEGIQREVALNPIVRQNIYLIYKEAINNIAKHSSASVVKIDLKQQNGRLEMTIADNGVSTNGSKVKGQGLENMRLRAKRIGGELDIQQTENGFSVHLKTPMTGK